MPGAQKCSISIGLYYGGGILYFAGEYSSVLLIAPYANALSASQPINLGLCDGGAGVYAFRSSVCFAFNPVVLFCGVSPNSKFVSSTMKLSFACKFSTSFVVASTTSNLAFCFFVKCFDLLVGFVSSFVTRRFFYIG